MRKDMTILKMLVELKYDNKIMHGKDKESIDWFYNDILKSKIKDDLVLHSNEIGDDIGTLKVVKILK